MPGCGFMNCRWWNEAKGACTDPNEYVNGSGEAVCGLRHDAIPLTEWNALTAERDRLRAEIEKLSRGLLESVTEPCPDIQGSAVDSALNRIKTLNAERDRLTVLAELVWQSKSLLEAHQHFVAWRDKTGDFRE